MGQFIQENISTQPFRTEIFHKENIFIGKMIVLYTRSHQRFIFVKEGTHRSTLKCSTIHLIYPTLNDKSGDEERIIFDLYVVRHLVKEYMSTFRILSKTFL